MTGNFILVFKSFVVNYRFSINILLLTGGLSLLTACSNDPKGKNHGPIILGDSSTIVMENDPVYLQDMVNDLQPTADEGGTEKNTEPVKDTAETPAKVPVADKTPAAAATTSQPTGNGLTIAFKEVSIFIPNITTRSYNKQDLQKARAATYEITNGSIAGNQLRITSGTVQKVTQRYQTVLALQDGDVQLSLESLGNYASDWVALRGSGNTFNIAGLEASKLEYKDVRPAAIRNAVPQATRKARMSRDEAADWQDYARDVRSTDKAPCKVILRSVSWRIEGKDAGGKAFNKEVRMDLPR